jgi:UDP-glucose 4-epimerase/GDP-4-dehydro-6-deoxy-D-mannose reductase
VTVIKRFLVTGSRGVLGKRILSNLFSKSHSSAFEFDGDVTDRDAVRDFFEKNEPFTHLIHAAALVPTAIVENNPARAYQVNVGGTSNIVDEFLKRNRSGHVTYVSSSHVYRPSRFRLNESARTEPMNTYGRTKLAGEFASLDICRSFNAKLCIARVFSLYSEDQSDEFLLPALQKKITECGGTPIITIPGWNNVRDFSSADSYAKAIVLLADMSVDGVLNLGSGRGKTVLAFAKERFEFGLRERKISRASPRNQFVANVTKLWTLGIKIDQP